MGHQKVQKQEDKPDGVDMAGVGPVVCMHGPVMHHQHVGFVADRVNR
jgi:hypothetical protein